MRNKFGKGEAELWGSYITLGIQREGEDVDTMNQISNFATRHGVTPIVETIPPRALECSRLTGAVSDLFVFSNRLTESYSFEVKFPDSYRGFESAGGRLPGGNRLSLGCA